MGVVSALLYPSGEWFSIESNEFRTAGCCFLSARAPLVRGRFVQSMTTAREDEATMDSTLACDRSCESLLRRTVTRSGLVRLATGAVNGTSFETSSPDGDGPSGSGSCARTDLI